MYFDTKIEMDSFIIDEIVEKEMYNTKKNAVSKLSSIVHPTYAKTFTQVLSYAWFDSHPDAEKIADNLDLGKLEFLSMAENFQEFKEEWLKDYEKNY